jgi:hypothetical protein
MLSEIRPSLRIFASYALLFCVMYAFLQFLVVPLHAKTTELRSAIISLTDQNNRFAGAIRQYEETLSTTRSEVPEPETASPGQLLDALTPALAGADLQSLLKSLVTESGALLAGSAIIEGEHSGNLQKLSVNLRLQCSVESLARFMHQVEAQDQALFFDNVVIQSQHRHGRVLQSANAELEVRLDVYGFMNVSGSAPQ